VGGNAKPRRADTDALTPTVDLRVHQLGDGAPAIARLHHKDSPCLNPGQAALHLTTATGLVPPSVRLLLAGGAFGRADFPAPTAGRQPSPAEYVIGVNVATGWLGQFDTAFPDRRLDIVFGLDVYAVNRGPDYWPEPVIQFVVLAARGRTPSTVVAVKRYPTVSETPYVYRAGAAGLPALFQTVMGPTLGLGCHEGTVYNPRGIARDVPGSWRATARAAVMRDFSATTAAVNIIHGLPSHKTFLASYRAAVAANPNVRILGAFGTNTDEAGAAEVLEMAEKLTIPAMPTVELIPAAW
jgi:hypothetical protein